ncbi:MAG: TIGR03084 family metal-binding protein [Alphaproteobacteria bacterium]|nr:TIGR03084 family metal-binding protein [Alphaproteobacteria bacterium]
MKQLADDLRAEGEELNALLATLSEDDWRRPTPFKDWTVEAVMQHLLVGDWMNALALTDPYKFSATLERRNVARAAGEKVSGLEFMDHDPGAGDALRASWHQGQVALCDLFAVREPKARMQWVGPDMSVRSGATARLMETWAHGQDIYDLLRQSRAPTDRLRNIATLGVNTYGWTFHNRGEDPPGPAPHVRLTAPSGATWTWNEPSETSLVEGAALEFCQVVTQGRNIADVDLTLVGEEAEKWMSIAQCFAGVPETPPQPGHRVWHQDL